MSRNSRNSRNQNLHPYRSPDKQTETRVSISTSKMINQVTEPSTRIYQHVDDDFRTERRKIIALLKNWHVRVQHKLGFDATLEMVKQKWTRFLDIDLLMDLEELEEMAKTSNNSSNETQQLPTTSQINEMFKDVVAFLEARQPCGSKPSESDHTYFYQGQLELPSQSHTKSQPPPNRIPLSEEVTKQLQETHQRLKDYFEGSIRRLNRTKSVSRRKVFTSCNSFVATAAVLGDTDTDIVDRLLTMLAPTAADLLFIDKRMPILSQHLKEQAPSMVAPITPTDVKWERCYTQQGRPMIQVDGYLFYVCPRQKKVGKKEKEQQQKRAKQKDNGDDNNNNKKDDPETVSYFRCITNRKGAPKCPVRIKLNCRNEIVFQNGRQHCHPPVDIARYSADKVPLRRRRKKTTASDQYGLHLSSSDQSSQM